MILPTICYLYVMSYKEKLAKKHKDIVSMGWIQTHRSESGGVGRTYENLLGIHENNDSKPDYGDIEIKTHRDKSNSNIHLFGKTPSSTSNPIKYLSYEYSDYERTKTFNVSLRTNMFIPKGDYYFNLVNDRKNQRLYICVYDETKKMIDNSVFYTYDEIGSSFFEKLKNLFFVKAKHEFNDDNVEEFKYYKSAQLFSNPSFNLFLDLVDSGDICCDIMVGTHTHGKKCGQFRDHGTRFGIPENKLINLYLTEEIVEDGEVKVVRDGGGICDWVDKKEESPIYSLF